MHLSFLFFEMQPFIFSKKMLLAWFAVGAALCLSSTRSASTLRTTTGSITLKSDAPLETIKASSHQLQGAIDLTNNTFAWAVEIKSFEGFNSPLQREHFNENYLESSKYPKATFTGKIIEKINFQTNGTYTVRAKGKLTIHGVTQERILKSTLVIRGGVARITSTFTVPLADHNINIPRVVYQKISEEILVTVHAELR
jgi:polyisoprenoid-binding protein YceI